MPTVINGDFEWDDDKAQANLEKHAVSFEEVARAFADPLAVLRDDGADMGRIMLIGMSPEQRLLAVVYEPRGERDRIISARLASRRERSDYEGGEL